MRKQEGYLEFITSENYKNQVEVWYKAYNITREKIDLFRDFILSLYDLIEETYLGPDILFEDIEQMNHFNWCWRKTIENFQKENIPFKETGAHRNYFWAFFHEAFYQNEVEGKTNRIRDYYNKLFSFNYKKSRSELDLLTEVYKTMESNIKK
jgi:hypothetical protein